jgi:hypothetical protein
MIFINKKRVLLVTVDKNKTTQLLKIRHLSSETLYNDLQTKVMKDTLRMRMEIHRDNKSNPPAHTHIYFIMHT